VVQAAFLLFALKLEGHSLARGLCVVSGLCELDLSVCLLRPALGIAGGQQTCAVRFGPSEHSLLSDVFELKGHTDCTVMFTSGCSIRPRGTKIPSCQPACLRLRHV
jgi:hypothetical protein